MPHIEESYIDRVACQLTFLGGLNPPTHRAIAYYNGHLAENPTVSETFEAFMGLPEEHPLRKKYDTGMVEQGYRTLDLHGNKLREGDSLVLEMVIFSR